MEPVLALRGVGKRFGATRALDGASLVVERGSIHGLIGQNGAGKSTIIKILAGLYQPDEGSITLAGEVLRHIAPRDIERRGVHIIHQDSLLPPTLTVAEALFLGHEPRSGPFLRSGAMRRRAEALINETFGLSIDGNALIGSLQAAQRQIVQITRALLHRPLVLVFDEPTAALVRREAARLFDIIRGLRDAGTSIIYISHYLEEVRALCDHITVLRNGRDVGSFPSRERSMGEIVSLMVNRDPGEMFPKRAGAPGETLLEVASLRRAGAFEDVSLRLRAGEIVGVTGLVGSGAKELLQCLFGLARPDGGQISVRGVPVALNSPGQAVRHGIGFVPEDRRRQGVAVDISVRENATLASLRRLTRFCLLDRSAERTTVRDLIARLSIKAPDAEALVRDLSGGNQQKLVLAKWLGAGSSIYLLDEPTVAVDVAAKVEIYRLLAELAGRGAGILLLSTDLAELLGLADRILVLHRGRIAADLRPQQTSSEALLAIASGAALPPDGMQAA